MTNAMTKPLSPAAVCLSLVCFAIGMTFAIKAKDDPKPIMVEPTTAAADAFLRADRAIIRECKRQGYGPVHPVCRSLRDDLRRAATGR